MAKVSIIIPVLNEAENRFLDRQFSVFTNLHDASIIYVDGGSTDGTIKRIRKAGFDVMETSLKSRGARLNAGFSQINDDQSLIILHHPRSVLSIEGITHLQQMSSLQQVWGGFTHQFDRRHPILKFTSWYSNHVRPLRGILYLDHCLFVSAKWLDQVGGVPEVEIFEDTCLSMALRRLGKPLILPYPSLTSSVRFDKNGVLKQALLNTWMKALFYLRRSPQRMNQHYEKNIELNSRY